MFSGCSHFISSLVDYDSLLYIIFTISYFLLLSSETARPMYNKISHLSLSWLGFMFLTHSRDILERNRGMYALCVYLSISSTCPEVH